MTFPLRNIFFFCNTCIRCKLLLENHFSKLSPYEWTIAISSNISNKNKINDHYFTSTVPNSTSVRMHSPSLLLLGINTSNRIVNHFIFYKSCKILAFLSTFASWFHHPLVLTCFSCHDLRMKANHEPLAQAWTFQNHTTSCHKKHH